MATTPYPFVSGAVLLASELNSTFNIPTSTKTDSYTLVAADAGKRIIMNKATATTITVDASVFAASDVVEILNIGAGTCTITAGTATVSTTGSLALAQNGSGRLVFTSASASFFEQAAVAQAASGLNLISSASFSGVSSFSLPTNTFTATYTNYQVFINLDSSASSETFSMRVRASGTDNSSANYAWVQYGQNENTGAFNLDSGGSLATSFRLPAISGTFTSQMQITIMAPADTNFNTGFNATGFYYDSATNFQGTAANGALSVTTAYDAATFIVGSGTVTGSYSVYGMGK